MHTTGGLAPRTRAVRWGLVVVLAVAAVALAATGVLEVCAESLAGSEIVQTCRPPRAGDGVMLAMAVLVAVLLAPDVSEVALGGVLTLRSRLDLHERELSSLGSRLESVQSQVARASSQAIGGGAFVQVISGVQTGRYASPPRDAGVPPGSVDQARYLAADLLLSHLGDLGSALLDGANLRLYLPSGDGSVLEPVLDPPLVGGGGSPRPGGDAWRAGEGVVGRAWSEGNIVLARGEEVLTGLERLPAARRDRYRELAVIVALPVINTAGHAVGVLSASSRDAASGLDTEDSIDELVAASQLVARILIDLLGWADDGSEVPSQAGAPVLDRAPECAYLDHTSRKDHHE
jgi:hypothetical protein